MEKEKADKIITDYMKKIYGFALSKTMDIDKAEELSSRIILEVYQSLLKSENVQNTISYIYRIASNTYSKFVSEEITNKQIVKQKILHPLDKGSENDKIYEKIRTEIAYLSKTQREIAILFYYEKQKIKDIAKKTNLTEKNVKWHLIDARNYIRTGFSEEKSSFSHKHKVFSKITGRGQISPLLIDIPFYFSKTLHQSIAYSAYHKPKTAVEVARELTTPAVFVEDEISFLVEYGFMNRIGKQKYQTNMHITALDKKGQESIDKVYRKYAKYYCDIYIPLLMKNASSPLSTAVYIPENDFNFLLWTLITFSCGDNTKFGEEDDLYKFYTKRIDGSNSIAYAHVHDRADIQENTPENQNDDFMITMNIYTSGPKKSKTWMYFSKYDERAIELFRYHGMFSLLYDFMKGNIKKDNTNINKYIRLFESGFIQSISPDGGDPQKKLKPNTEIVNMIVTTLSLEAFQTLFPAKPDELLNHSKEIEKELYLIKKKYYPPKLQELIRLESQGSYLTLEATLYILEHLLNTNILKPLEKQQRKTANMILFTDVLPAAYPRGIM